MSTTRVQAKTKSRKTSRAEGPRSGSASLGRQIVVSDLLQAVEYLDQKDVDEIHRAYRFGEGAHAGQARQSGEAYIHHPLAVACILADLHLDGRSIIAAVVIYDQQIKRTRRWLCAQRRNQRIEKMATVITADCYGDKAHRHPIFRPSRRIPETGY